MKPKYLLLIFAFLKLIPINAQCSFPTAQAELNINNVRALLLNGGDFWWNGVSEAGYQFPIAELSGIAKYPIFSGAIWLTALDSNDSLLTAAMTYRNGNGYEFYPGPINSQTESVSFNSCEAFNQFWEIYRSDIEMHVNNINHSNLPLPLNQIPSSVLNWPAKGNAHFNAYFISEDLAPFFDYNNNNEYDPEYGDYPLIKGDQAIFCVYNDIGGTHSNSNGNPLGVEVQFMAYAYNTQGSILSNTTFYDIKVIKKTQGTANNFSFGLFVDPDLGDYSDDLVGCDTTFNYGFMYNANAIDLLYGNNVPIISTLFLDKELTSFSYTLNSNLPSQSDPTTDEQFRNYMTNKWKDGTPFTYGGTGYGGTLPTKHIYSGNPAHNGEWIDQTQNQDKRYNMVNGFSQLNFGDTYSISFATLAIVPENYNGIFDKDTLIQPFVNEVLLAWDDSIQFGKMYDLSPLAVLTNLQQELFIYPNPVSNKLCIETSTLDLLGFKLFDYTGNLILENNIDLTNIVDLNFSNLPKGIYFLQLETKQGTQSFKVLKE